MACDNCRAKKVKCDASEGSQCSYCRVHHIKCKITPAGKPIPSRVHKNGVRNARKKPPPHGGQHNLKKSISRQRHVSPSYTNTGDEVPLFDCNPLFYEPKTPYPAPEILEMYVNQYFEVAQLFLPILHRATFERQVRYIYQNPRTPDPALFALCNAVFALGCEHLQKEPGSDILPTTGESQSIAFFENAMGVLDEICHPSSGIMGLQALTVMVICAQFVQTIDPELEYQLCSLAVQLASMLGLYDCGQVLGDAQQQQQHQVFLILYSLDKALSLRRGRPSALSDHIIPCPPSFNSHLCAGEQMFAYYQLQHSLNRRDDENFLLYIVKYGHLCSLIADSLPPSTRQDNSLRIRTLALDLARRLKAWKDCIPERFRLGEEFQPLQSDHSSLQHACILHFCYAFAMCTIYDRLLSASESCTAQANGRQDAGEQLESFARECFQSAHITVDLITRSSVARSIPKWIRDSCPTISLQTIIKLRSSSLQGCFTVPGISTMSPSGSFSLSMPNASRYDSSTTPLPSYCDPPSDIFDLSFTSLDEIPSIAESYGPELSVVDEATIGTPERDSLKAGVSLEEFNSLLSILENGFEEDTSETEYGNILDGILS